jgi:agmatine deiminase
MFRRSFLAGATMTALPFAAQAKPGWHVPAEEAPHQATFMMWTNSRRVYRDRAFLETTQDTIAKIASVIAEFEPVILCAPDEEIPHIRDLVSAGVALWDIPTEDLWARDAGPIFAKRGDALAVVQIQFNGWGEKQVHRHDAQVAARVAERLGLPVLETALKGEGGGLDHDAGGLIIAHESSWVKPDRNPGLSRAQIEAALLDAYGARRVIWAPGLKDQDITDYHIDSLARLTAPNRVLINLPDDPDPRDPFHQAALQTHDILAAAGLDIDVIPEPNRRRVTDPEFVASYANFYVCNGAVIAAQFGDRETDALAEDALRRHYPGREIVMLNVDPLGELGGGIHCATVNAEVKFPRSAEVIFPTFGIW